MLFIWHGVWEGVREEKFTTKGLIADSKFRNLEQ